MKDIYRPLPDNDFDYDGEEFDEESEIEYQEMLENWRFEMSTYNY